MLDAFWGVPILFGLFFVLIFVIVIGGIIFAIVKGITTWQWNNQQPLQTVMATLVSKRTNTSGMGSSMNSNMSGSASTWYYATFEMPGGQRQEFGLGGREYGLLAEGDSGTLKCQGIRYKGFSRSVF